MKVRTGVAAVAVAAVGSVAVVAGGASAGQPPVLDGKRVKVLSFTGSGGVADHDTDQATQLTKAPDRAQCDAPRCASMVFVYKPAKGVNADTAYTLHWTNPLSDFDLYIAEVAKDGSRSTVAKCGAGAGTSEKVFVPAGTLRSGHRYAIVVDFYRSVSETMTAKVEMPGTNSIVSTAPGAVDKLEPINCGL
jgi:hypothetical protein